MNMRNQKEDVFNRIEAIKENNRRWENAKAKEVENGKMRKEELDAPARHIKQLEELLRF